MSRFRSMSDIPETSSARMVASETLLTASLSWKEDEYRSLFPLCICLGRLDPNMAARRAQRYHVGQIFSYKGLSGIDGKGNTELEVNFMLPEYEKLAGESYLHHILSLGFRLWYAYGCFSQLT
ncbi:hypothetical protein JHK82_056903 [Glycine max]|nr:hypothetical protein JHK82_056903 [Glycine max]